jgi:hypothetical protein
MCHELRLLENGREDRTPVRADLQGGSPFGVPREMNLSVNSVAEFSLGDTNVINRQRSQESRFHFDPALDNQSFVRRSNR